ncbi:MAG: WYL domain-containing transcriptional regulator [Gemmatimonadales bacterium]|nr:MAG: WYL domain-containing transcriptional regulator [Gemmatimonadales bacterium]
MSPGKGGALDRLSRLLYLIPAATRPDGARISELCRILEVEPQVLHRDVQVLAEREMYLAAGAPGSLQVEWEPAQDRIRIWSPGPFRRPLRLSRREAMAALLGFRSRVLSLGGPGEVGFRELAELIQSTLATPEEGDEGADALPVFDASLAEPDAEIRDEALDAMAQGRVLRFTYLKPSAAKAEWRRLEPYATIHAEGHWYLLGRDPESDGMRAFRMDRILEAAPTDDRFEFPDGFEAQDYARDARLFFQAPHEAEPEAVSIIYSSRIARWIRERYRGEELPDGSFRVTHPVVSREWLVRHVLGYGGEARAEGPAAEWIRSALSP